MHGAAQRPVWHAVVRAQARLLWFSGRPLLLLGVFACIAIFIQVFGATDRYDGALNVVVSPALPVVLAVVGAAWGWIVWWEEGPRQRTYHWSLPVHTATHDSARVAAGALWLLPALALMLVFAVALAGLQRDAQMSALRHVPILYWLSLVTAAWTGYLFAAALSTATNRFIETVVIGALCIQLARALIDSFDYSNHFGLYARYYMDLPLHGDWGLLPALEGMGIAARAGLTTGTATTSLAGMLTSMLWLLAAAILVLIAARRHP